MVKALYFQSSGRTNDCQIKVLFKWLDQSCTPSVAPLKEHGNLVSELFKFGVKSYFVDISCSIGFIKEVVHLLNKYDLSHNFIDWYHTGFFPTKNGNKLSRSAFKVKKMHTGQILLSCANLYPKVYQHLQK